MMIYITLVITLAIYTVNRTSKSAVYAKVHCIKQSVPPRRFRWVFSRVPAGNSVVHSVYFGVYFGDSLKIKLINLN